MYLRLRRPMSAHRGGKKLRRNARRPSFQSHSESVPTGQSQLQNALRKISEIARNEISRNIPAGCSRGNSPVRRKTFRFINEAIGSQPSTPGGRWTQTERPPV